MTIGRSPEAEVFLDDVTVSRNHALLVRRRDGLYIDDLGLAQRHLRQPPPDRVAQARGRRTSSRSANTSSPISRNEPRRGIFPTGAGPARAQSAPTPEESAESLRERARGPPRGAPPRRQVADDRGPCASSSRREFPDISISKIRYLEDQKLLSPRRTQGGYRLYTPAERGQAAHDPAPPGATSSCRWRVIRQELAAGRADSDTPTGGSTRPAHAAAFQRCGEGLGRRVLAGGGAGRDRRGRQARGASWRTSGVIKGERRDGDTWYDDTGGARVVRAARELARFGVGGRNLRVFPHLGGPRVGPARADPRSLASLPQSGAAQGGGWRRSRTSPRSPSHMKYLLLVRDLRRLAS